MTCLACEKNWDLHQVAAFGVGGGRMSGQQVMATTTFLQPSNSQRIQASRNMYRGKATSMFPDKKSTTSESYTEGADHQ